MILVRGGGRAFSYLPRRSSSQRGGVGGGGGAHDYYFFFFARPGGGEYYCLGARWADGEGGRAGKISMSDFGKRRGESIILFAKKEFKPEGRGRGRGGGVLLLFFFLQGRGGGEYYCLGARLADGEGGRGGRLA